MNRRFIAAVAFGLIFGFIFSIKSHAQSGEDDPGRAEEVFDAILRALIDEVDGQENPAEADEESTAAALPHRPDVPEFVYKRIESFPEIADIEIVKRPGEYFGGPGYAARIVYTDQRPGYKACGDHYPVRYVALNETCPDIHEGEAPTSGWMSCGAFYAPHTIGCPPEPRTPIAPGSTPKPQCQLGASRCATELPGGPGILRIPKKELLQIKPAISADVVNREAMSARVVPASPQAEAAASAPTTRSAARTVDPAALRRQRLEAIAPHICQNGDCRIGGAEGEPITLPRPPLTPLRHAPCGYEHVDFFVPENRFCPRADYGERPAPGYALFITWLENDASSIDLYYHYDDHDGVIRVAYMLFGATDDRFLMTGATAFEKAAAAMTAMLVENDRLAVNGGSAALHDDPDWTPLCGGERFAGLPRPGRCSGVKVGDRLVATSAHCMRNDRVCEETSIVFGYFNNDPSADPRAVSPSQIYQCTSIVALRKPEAFGERGADWAIFEVDRTIDAPNATLAPSDNVDPGVVTTVIGHPMGLPTIVTRLGVVQAVTSQYFVSNSDTFVGNSGSAVFAAHSVEDGAPKVIGLLTGGRYDFDEEILENDETCVKEKWCRDADCLGDDVVYTDDLIAILESYAPSDF